LLAVSSESLVEVDPSTAAATPAGAVDQSLRFGSIDVPGTTTSPAGDAVAALRRARQVRFVAVAALQAGLAARAVEMTVAYTKERVQFGRAIGSFQALKHRMADMLVLQEMTRSASWSASYAVSTHADNAEQLAHVAKSYCSDALDRIAAETVQLHGGIAITWEHDAQLVFKRAHALSQLFGQAHEHRALIDL
jgi:alkylation response protein AidB-like acyl-CoA dehydrogenase